jgi:hypothetical protein
MRQPLFVYDLYRNLRKGLISMTCIDTSKVQSHPVTDPVNYTIR